MFRVSLVMALLVALFAPQPVPDGAVAERGSGRPVVAEVDCKKDPRSCFPEDRVG